MSQQELLRRVIQALDDAGIEYIVTGSVASSLQGEPRSTHDIDLVAAMERATAGKPAKAFPSSQDSISARSLLVPFVPFEKSRRLKSNAHLDCALPRSIAHLPMDRVHYGWETVMECIVAQVLDEAMLWDPEAFADLRRILFHEGITDAEVTDYSPPVINQSLDCATTLCRRRTTSLRT